VKRLLAIVCLFRGHYSTMVALPEHGFGLYAFSWLGCGRCGRTEARREVRFAPCWLCPEGKCDRCEECTTAAGLFALVDKMASGTLREPRP
jgi:hypothetical protein